MSGFLYVHADGTLTARTDHPEYVRAQSVLASFADLEQQLDPVHVYRLRPLTLWQAAAAGLTDVEVLTFLRNHAVHPLPLGVQQRIRDEMRKWGQLTLHAAHDGHIVMRGDPALLRLLAETPDVAAWARERRQDGILFSLRQRAEVKRTLSRLGHPVVDAAGYQTAPQLAIALRPDVHLRDYQENAVKAFFSSHGGQSGIVVLPCGAGKTLVGIAVLARLAQHTLILTPGEAAAIQWRRELLRWTRLNPSHVSLYQRGRKPAPVTITTYQRVAARTQAGLYQNLDGLTRYPWGLVIYDEVHVLPAPLFRLAADLQGARRLGLTATLVREDGLESDVFSLIGPKLYEAQWKPLEREGYLAAVTCVEVNVPWHPSDHARYLTASATDRHRIASANTSKLQTVLDLVRRHHDASILIIGHYLDPLSRIAASVGCPLVTGKTPKAKREELFRDFRSGRVRCLALSRVANMSIDLPCASVAIQVSGLFGSRQEEAQRLGRLLRPDSGPGIFYSLVTEDSVEQVRARHRQMFLVEQGYTYQKMHATEILSSERMPARETDGVFE
jgi:DNA excision repair protein ERCC-3